ncbi:MAG: hypothetical protein QXD32_03945 [Nitrososphaerota archaeon]
MTQQSSLDDFFNEESLEGVDFHEERMESRFGERVAGLLKALFFTAVLW